MFGFSFRNRNRKPARDNSAQTAKERLQILLAHERSDTARADRLPLLQRDIMEVVKRHMEIDTDSVDIKFERGEDISSLEINIELPGANDLVARHAS
jgi:cell division topological specificity factor